MNLERYFCLALAKQNLYIFPLRLCAFAPLRETAYKFPRFSQRRKGAKLAKQIPKRRWLLSEADND
jgi:hypothetical protein